MNKIAASLLAVATTFLALSSAHAQDAAPNLYAEIGYAQLNPRGTVDAVSLKLSPKAITGVFGYQFTPNVAVEGLLGFGAGGGTLKINGVDTSADGKVKNAVGVFLKPSVAVSDTVELFGRLGWAHTKLELSGAGASYSDSGSGLAYGFGAHFNLSKTSYIQAGWMNYYEKDGFKIDGFNVAYGMRF